MERNSLFNLLFASMVFITAASLSALGEGRLDVYLSLYTLEYFICLALLRPRRRARDPLAFTLFLAFLVAVARRVMEVLGS